MKGAIYRIPEPQNEPLLKYSPGSPERESLKRELERMRSEEVDIPMIIDGKEIRTNKKVRIHPPHEIRHTLGYYSQGGKDTVQMAIDAALKAKDNWMNTAWEERASIFLKAADLLSGPYRNKLNAASMLGQSKNPFQAEIDSACELIDFFRFNAKFMERIYTIQPNSVKGIWNRTDWRPLEGFVFALTPFNFTSIAGNLPTAPAMLGNTVVWKASKSQIYSASAIMELLIEAGLPDGVINLIFVSGPEAADVILNNKHFAGLHFTGSTKVFQGMWKTIGENISNYVSYPRIVGETGGKDFVLAHPSAHARQVSTALVRGAFEFQGQKCSAASRAYIPESLWKGIHDYMKADLADMKMGPPEDFGNFINAVIDEASFNKLTGVIEKVKKDKNAEIVLGGKYDNSVGYFIEPTVVLTTDPHYYTMKEELFGPILTIYVYPDDKFDDTLTLIDTTSNYALTGAIFSQDRSTINKSMDRLRFAAGNFYINDKPTGAVVGQQPFGGARGSGTNDKAGSILNLLRWVSARSIKENFNPPENYKYPFME